MTLVELANVAGPVVVIGATWHLSAKMSRLETKVENLEKRFPEAKEETSPARKRARARR